MYRKKKQKTKNKIHLRLYQTFIVYLFKHFTGKIYFYIICKKDIQKMNDVIKQNNNQYFQNNLYQTSLYYM